jgi:hypothetical protein
MIKKRGACILIFHPNRTHTNLRRKLLAVSDTTTDRHTCTPTDTMCLQHLKCPCRIKTQSVRAPLLMHCLPIKARWPIHPAVQPHIADQIKHDQMAAATTSAHTTSALRNKMSRAPASPSVLPLLCTPRSHCEQKQVRRHCCRLIVGGAAHHAAPCQPHPAQHTGPPTQKCAVH